MSDNNICEYRLDLYPTRLDRNELAKDLQKHKTLATKIDTFETQVLSLCKMRNNILRTYVEIRHKIPEAIKELAKAKINLKSADSESKKLLLQSRTVVLDINSDVIAFKESITKFLVTHQELLALGKHLTGQMPEFQGPQAMMYMWSNVGRELIPNPQAGWSLIDEISRFRLHVPKSNEVFELCSIREFNDLCSTFTHISKTIKEIPPLGISIQDDPVFTSLEQAISK